jgi:hypothetical protein
MTRDGVRGPMRTEDDLRQALATLERHAPSAEIVLAAVHGATGAGAGRGAPGRIRRWRPPAAPRWWWRPRLVLSLAVAAAAAGLVITVLPGSASRPGSRPGPAGPPSSSSGQTGLPGSAPREAGLPTAAALGRAMLTAFNGIGDDIEYATETSVTRGVTVDVYRDWSWPAQPSVGQRQVDRTVFAERTPKVPALTVVEDSAIAFTTPRPAASRVRAQLTMVCFGGTGQTACGFGPTNTPAGTWSRISGRFAAFSSDIGAGGFLSPASLARGIAEGEWRVVHRARIAGQPAIELSETNRGPDHIMPLPTLLWVNARTHLPIRMVNGVGHATVTTNEWTYLRPTTANLRLLQVPIPPGYPRYVPKR